MSAIPTQTLTRQIQAQSSIKLQTQVSTTIMTCLFDCISCVNVLLITPVGPEVVDWEIGHREVSAEATPSGS